MTPAGIDAAGARQASGPARVMSAPPPEGALPVRVAREAAYVLRFIWTHPANRGHRIRRVARALSFQIRGRVLRRRTVAPIGERSRMWAELHVYNSTKALYANPPDWPEMLVWRDLGPGDLFLDVGANVGIYALFTAERGAHVIAVEPNGDAVRRMRENVALNGYKIEILQAVLADAPGTALVTTDLDMGNHLVVGEMSNGNVEPVPGITLDDLLGDRTAAGVKIDVEGAESIVLAGATRALAEKRIRLLQIEWNGCSLDLLGEPRSVLAGTLASYGYELLRPDESGTLRPVRTLEPGPDVFARPRG